MAAKTAELAPPYARDKFPRWDACEDCRAVHMRTGEDDTRCAICRTKAGLAPLSVPFPPPWYETMAPEELQRIRDKRWVPPVEGGEAVIPQSAGTPPAPPVVGDFSQPAAWYMTYRAAKGDNHPRLMVGKTIRHPAHGLVFLHAAGNDVSEGQAHRATDCPVPVDTLVVAKLLEIGVKYFYGYDRDNGMLYRAEVADIMRAPSATYSARTIRQRQFLAVENWTTLAEVVEVKIPGHPPLSELRKDGKPILSLPYLTREIDLSSSDAF